VTEPELIAREREVTAPVAASVVGEDPLDRDPVAGIEAPGPAEEVGRRHWALVGQLLGIGEPAMVVDREVDPVPADPAVPVPGIDAVDPVTAAWADPAEHLRVEVDELTRPIALVADDRRPRLEAVEPAEAFPPEDRVDTRAGKPALPCQDVWADSELTPAGTELLDEFGRMSASLVVDRARSIGETTHLGAMPPLRAGLAADAGRPGRRGDRPAGSNAIGEQPATVRGQPGIRMGHRGLLLRLRLRHQQPRIGALSPSTT